MRTGLTCPIAIVTGNGGKNLIVVLQNIGCS